MTIRVTDRAASERFYNTVLESLGTDQTYRTATFSEWQDLSLAGADQQNPATRRLHLGFVAPSREQVDLFWQTGTEAGFASDGAPGPRPQYRKDYYGAFLLDPDGNSAEAVHHGGLRRGGGIDHLWIRVADLAASARFYQTIAPHAGLRVRTRRQIASHLAEPRARSHWSRERRRRISTWHFRRPTTMTSTASTRPRPTPAYRSHGPPGERPRYHRGYYAAYVLDPDGNNIEVVNHHRA